MHALGVSARAIATMSCVAEQSRDGRETGGILLGTSSTSETVVIEAGSPGPQATRSRNRFTRDLRYSQLLAQRAWEAHGAQWIGEWHTHLSALAEPSNFDLQTYYSHLNDPSLYFDTFFSIIIEVQPTGPRRINAWAVTLTAVKPLSIHYSIGGRQ